MIVGIVIGVLASWLVALLGLLTLDADLRRAVGEALLAVILSPAFLVVTMARRGPRAARIQPRAVERFVRMLDEDMEPAWVLSYAGRGMILVRRRSGTDWRNNVPNRVTDAGDLR